VPEPGHVVGQVEGVADQTNPDVLHERALAIRSRRFDQQRGSYEDLLDITRHLAALHRYDDIADLADQAVQVLPGTLATVACLAEIRPLIPPPSGPGLSSPTSKSGPCSAPAT